MSGTNTREHFATLPPKQAISEMLKRIEDFDDHVIESGRWRIWARSYNFYNRGIYKDVRLNRVGEQSEYTETYVNHFRNLLTHILNMTTNQRPSFDARATNTDFKSQAQTIVGNGILDFYNRFKGMDKVSKTAVEDVLVFADSYVYLGWDFSLGDPAVPDQNSPGGVMKQGDIMFKNYTPVDVIFDFSAGLHDAPRQWYILRDFQNKWDLMQRYPEMAEKILSLANNDKTWQRTRMGYGWDKPSDLIPVYLFVHDRTDAVTAGRYFSFIGDDCWLIDSPLPEFYKRLPVHRLCASEQRGSGFGYSAAYDLLPLQEMLDGLYSIVVTNQSTFGVQNILMPTGSNINVAELADGLNLINYDPKQGPPAALNLTSTPEEIFAFMQRIEAVMETLSGVNSVARGNPGDNLKSGSALALVQSMAIQFLSGLQQNYVVMLEELGTGVIEILQKCATTKRMIEVAGKSNKAYMKSFVGSDISEISRVTVDVGNPLSRTTAGKVSMADNLLQAGLIEDAGQYIQVLTTGKLEPAIESKQSELMLIRSENEAMSDGNIPQAVAFDNHSTHVLEHRAVLASPEARNDPKIVTAVIQHIQQHINLWKGSDPALLMMLKEPLPPPPPMIAPPAGPGTPEPGPAGDAHALNGNQKQLLAVPPVEAEASKVRMPNMPKNPMNKVAVGG